MCVCVVFFFFFFFLGGGGGGEINIKWAANIKQNAEIDSLISVDFASVLWWRCYDILW